MRLLLAEDERDLAAAIARGLAGEGYAVEVVHDGLDGLWRAREGSYAAIVLDVLLPGMDGFAICRTLRSENVWTPILILTAKNAPADEAKALDIGADDFLAKPFSFEVLLARLRAIQRRGTAPRPSKLMLGDLSLDPTTRECRRGDTTIDLTPREYALLDALMRRPGEIVPKSELLDRVWGIDFDGTPAIVEVYIGYLRNKIDRPFGTQIIRTVRGVGYELARGSHRSAV